MLVGTGDIRTWLALASNDTGPNQKLENLSNAVQDFIENQCNRKFEAVLYKTHPYHCYFDGTGQAFIYLPQYPIWYVNEVAIDADRNFAAGATIATDDIIVYPQEGKIVSEAGYFTRGRRNVRVEYYAGYGTGSYPVPFDLKQVIIEMSVQAVKEGITAVHTVVGTEETKFIQMLNKDSMWRKTIMSYKNMAVITGYGYDTS